MIRWKMKTGLTSGNKGERELTLVLAKYGDDNLPIERHVIAIPENASNFDVCAALNEIATEICPGDAK